jgi:hypothetical protein
MIIERSETEQWKILFDAFYTLPASLPNGLVHLMLRLKAIVVPILIGD